MQKGNYKVINNIKKKVLRGLEYNKHTKKEKF